MASLVNQTGAAGVAAPMGGMAMMASPLQKVAVYVGDLADSVTEAHLFEVFNAIGPVASVRVCRDQITRRSLGYAYVNFAKHEDADRAIEEMNFTELHGKPMRMMWSERDPSKRRSNKGNLFVKNLHESIGSKELFDTFSLIGKIKSCRVVVDGKGVTLVADGPASLNILEVRQCFLISRFEHGDVASRAILDKVRTA